DRPVMGPEEAVRFLERARGTKWEHLWIVLLTTGLRPGEALGLKWEDLDGDQLRVQRSLVYRSQREWAFAEPKTARSRRVVVLPAIALEALKERRKRYAEAKLRGGQEFTDHGLIFAEV